MIGVGELPLQNEAEVSAARVGSLQQSQFQSQGMLSIYSILHFSYRVGRNWYVKTAMVLIAFSLSVAST